MMNRKRLWNELVEDARDIETIKDVQEPRWKRPCLTYLSSFHSSSFSSSFSSSHSSSSSDPCLPISLQSLTIKEKTEIISYLETFDINSDQQRFLTHFFHQCDMSSKLWSPRLTIRQALDAASICTAFCDATVGGASIGPIGPITSLSSSSSPSFSMLTKSQRQRQSSPFVMKSDTFYSWSSDEQVAFLLLHPIIPIENSDDYPLSSSSIANFVKHVTYFYPLIHTGSHKGSEFHQSLHPLAVQSHVQTNRKEKNDGIYIDISVPSIVYKDRNKRCPAKSTVVKIMAEENERTLCIKKDTTNVCKKEEIQWPDAAEHYIRPMTVNEKSGCNPFGFEVVCDWANRCVVSAHHVRFLFVHHTIPIIGSGPTKITSKTKTSKTKLNVIVTHESLAGWMTLRKASEKTAHHNLIGDTKESIKKSIKEAIEEKQHELTARIQAFIDETSSSCLALTWYDPNMLDYCWWNETSGEIIITWSPATRYYFYTPPYLSTHIQLYHSVEYPVQHPEWLPPKIHEYGIIHDDIDYPLKSYLLRMNVPDIPIPFQNLAERMRCDKTIMDAYQTIYQLANNQNCEYLGFVHPVTMLPCITSKGSPSRVHRHGYGTLYSSYFHTHPKEGWYMNSPSRIDMENSFFYMQKRMSLDKTNKTSEKTEKIKALNAAEPFITEMVIGSCGIWMYGWMTNTPKTKLKKVLDAYCNVAISNKTWHDVRRSIPKEICFEFIPFLSL